MHTLDNALNNALDSAFDNLQLDNDVDFYPRRGFDHTRGSENWDFYVVTRGHVAGIYTHW
jgi:viroplasmin and RNaseH domain-containing protein